MRYYTYIVKCKDDSLYTGITTDLDRRIKEHNSNNSKTKYTKTRQPVKLVYKEEHSNRSNATKREIEIKNLNKTDKLKLCQKKP